MFKPLFGFLMAVMMLAVTPIDVAHADEADTYLKKAKLRQRHEKLHKESLKRQETIRRESSKFKRKADKLRQKYQKK